MKIFYIFFIFYLITQTISVNKPDFARMMNQKRELIKKLRKEKIPINRSERYSEKI